MEAERGIEIGCGIEIGRGMGAGRGTEIRAECGMGVGLSGRWSTDQEQGVQCTFDATHPLFSVPLTLRTPFSVYC